MFSDREATRCHVLLLSVEFHNYLHGSILVAFTSGDWCIAIMLSRFLRQNLM